MDKLQYLRHCTFKNFGNDLEYFFHLISSLHQNIKFTMGKESNDELTFRDTLFKRNNGKVSELLYGKPTQTDQYTYTTALITKQVVRKVLFPPFFIEHIPVPPLKIT